MSGVWRSCCVCGCSACASAPDPSFAGLVACAASLYLSVELPTSAVVVNSLLNSCLDTLCLNLCFGTAFKGDPQTERCRLRVVPKSSSSHTDVSPVFAETVATGSMHATQG